MDYSLYVAKTLTVAIYKIGPVIGFLIFSYFVFLKLPFLFFKNSLRSQGHQGFDPKEIKDPGFNFDDYHKFMHRQERIGSGSDENQQKKEEKKSEPKTPKSHDSGTSPEEVIFNFKAGERFTNDQLKKRYRELVKKNHPDMVASEGTKVRKFAEKKTKDINSAYEKLKSKAA